VAAHQPWQSDLVPQAIINRPPSWFASRLHTSVVQGIDDFDSFEGLTLLDEQGMPLALRRYAGHPAGTATLYIPHTIRDVREISDIVAGILGDFGLGQMDLRWQRRDDPEL
jgi:hypothetical protein